MPDCGGQGSFFATTKSGEGVRHKGTHVTTTGIQGTDFRSAQAPTHRPPKYKTVIFNSYPYGPDVSKLRRL